MFDVHPENLGEVTGRWEPLARFRLAVGYGPPYGSSDLFVDGDRAVGVDIHLRRGTSHTGTIRPERSTSTSVLPVGPTARNRQTSVCNSAIKRFSGYRRPEARLRDS